MGRPWNNHSSKQRFWQWGSGGWDGACKRGAAVGLGAGGPCCKQGVCAPPWRCGILGWMLLMPPARQPVAVAVCLNMQRVLTRSIDLTV